MFLNMRSAIKLLMLTAALSLLASRCGDNTPAYKNAGLSTDKRVADLLERMTPEEKIGQLICPLGWPMYNKVSADSVEITDLYRNFVDSLGGGMLWAAFRADPWTRKTLETGLNPQLAAKTYNLLQKYSIEHSRLGIPIILAEEAPHGQGLNKVFLHALQAHKEQRGANAEPAEARPGKVEIIQGIQPAGRCDRNGRGGHALRDTGPR